MYTHAVSLKFSKLIIPNKWGTGHVISKQPMTSVLFLWRLGFYLLKFTYSSASQFIISHLFQYVTMEWNTFKPSHSAMSGSHKILSYKIQNFIILRLLKWSGHASRAGSSEGPHVTYTSSYTHVCIIVGMVCRDAFWEHYSIWFIPKMW